MIELNKTFALAIDYQERLVPAVHDKDELIANSVKLLKGLKILNVPTFITEQYSKGLGPTISPILEATGIKEEAHIEKLTFGAYPKLKGVIPSKEERPYVVICGIESHICVMQTALGLKEAGYKPILIVDAISSREKKDTKIALKRAEREGILVGSVESILFELLNVAGTDTFKEISRLVK